jgi:GTP-binding protein
LGCVAIGLLPLNIEVGFVTRADFCICESTEASGFFTPRSIVCVNVFDAWRPDGGRIPRRTSGVLVSDRTGTAVAYGLNGLTDRGIFFVAPGAEVYEGMIVGENNKDDDLPVNVCRQKKLTNMRASGRDENVNLAPPQVFSLEESLEYLEDDELMEVTPRSLRLRKRVLNADQRKKQR